MAHEPEMSHHFRMKEVKINPEDAGVNSTGFPDRLAHIMALQREFQEEILGHGDLSDMDPDNRAAYFRDQMVSLTFELGEVGNEIGWKPWATSRHLNPAAYASECIDVFHFLLNLMFIVDMTPSELYEGYLKKQATNRARQRDGYDGVTEKCPRCHRSLDDVGVKCRKPTPDAHGWCAVGRGGLGIVVEDEEYS